MTKNYVELPTPIDQDETDTLLRINTVATDARIDFMLVGAFARDVFFEHGHNILIRRNTKDLDFGLQMASWSQYDQFRALLLADGFSQPDDDHPEQLQDRNGLFVDLVPFGDLAEDGTLLWPDGQRWVVDGFREAFEHALWIQVANGEAAGDLRILSPPSLVMLKLISAHERPEDAVRIKIDSNDIDFVLKNYLQAGNQWRLESGEDSDLMDVDMLDLEQASARLLGRDIGRLISSVTKDCILGILQQETTSSSRCPIAHEATSYNNGDFHRARDLLVALQTGIEDVVGQEDANDASPTPSVTT